MLQTAKMAQGRKGTGGNSTQVGVRVPNDLYSWLEDGKGPRDTDTDRVIGALELARDVEAAAGERMPELRATALLSKESLGQAIARLALEAIDGRKKGKR